MSEIIFECLSHSPEETEEFGRKIGQYILKSKDLLMLENQIFLALYGDIGAGKTVFVKGLASVLTPNEFVCSPTYALVNEYKGIINICHYDMYRITDENDLESTGFYDYKNCVIAAEWCENIEYALPDNYIKVSISKLENGVTRSLVAERITKL